MNRPRPIAALEATTTVLTPSGPKPIYKIRPGDLVMSPTDDAASSLIARKVVSLSDPVRAEIKMIGATTSLPGHVPRKVHRLFMTYRQPVWVRDSGWVPAEKLLGDWMGPSPLQSHDGGTAYADPMWIYQTPRQDVGWIGSASLEGYGYTWDFRAGRCPARC